MRRLLRRLFLNTPYYPVRVVRRPAPTEEDPTIAQKVKAQRAWMKEQGIEEPVIERRPPKAAGRLGSPREPLSGAEPDW